VTGDRHRAEDLAQIALADVLRHWRRVEAASSPTAYARRVLVNAHLSWHRRRWTTERPAEVG
jgi:DNA-directed RNA polymerase specialized sigma24 family protein